MELLNPLSVGRGLQLFTPQRFRADCLLSDVVGNAVYITGPVVAGVYQVSTADPQDAAKMPAVGVIVEKVSDTECFVQSVGELTDVYAGLTPGRQVFVEVGGTVGQTYPTAMVGGTVRIQYVGLALAADAVFLCPNFLLSVKRG